MKRLSIVTLANLSALVIYATLIYNNHENTGSDDLGGLLLLAGLITVHVGICTVTSIICFLTRHKDYGKGFLLSAMLVLVVGFSSCLQIFD